MSACRVWSGFLSAAARTLRKGSLPGLAGCTLLLLATSVQLSARQAPPLFLVADGDSVRVLVPNPPAAPSGFVLYRGLVGTELELVTPDPVRPVRDPGLAAAMLGDDLDMVLQALRTTEPGEILRRLRTDQFASHVLSLLSVKVATILGRHFQDRDLQPGQEYEYRLVFTDARDQEMDLERTGRVLIEDIPPGEPQELSAEPEDDEIVLRWRYPAYTGDPRDLVLGFHVYRADAEDAPPSRITVTPVMRDDVSPPRYRDREVSPGKTYRYQVRAVDMMEREGEPATAAAALPVVIHPPAPPAELTTRPGENVVRMVWRMSPEVEVTGYHVERSTGLDQPYERLTVDPIPVLRPEYRDTTVRGGVQYFYRIVAVAGEDVESRPSNAVHAVPIDRTPPEPPANVRIEVDTARQLVIRWEASPSTDVVGYYVYRGADERRLVRLVQRPVAATEFIDTGYDGSGLSPGARYHISVSAVDASFNESEAVSAETTVPDDEPPTPPTGFTARNVNGHFVALNWSASASLDVENYVLYRLDAEGQREKELGRFAADGDRRARDATVTRGEHYTYHLIAVDTAGNESEAAETTIHFRGFDPPPAPRHLAANASDDGVELRWERVVHSELVGYHVYRATRPTGIFQRLTPEPVDALTFTDPDGAETHYYKVRAVDVSGNESSPSPVAGGR